MTKVLGGADWFGLKAPDLEAFEKIAYEVYASLDPAFRAACGNLLISVEDFPSNDVIDEMGLECPFDILGLFQGVGITERGEVQTGDPPNMVWLYRRPILDYWSDYDETLGHIIAHVLIHEIGHQMGLSDEDMERIERAGGHGS